MDATTWYLGPLGDLRPLPCPDDGVSRSVERFGGIHQALSGARTMDVTGHRASYELKIPWLTPEESRFLEALHYRTVPGPIYLIDPMATNRLTRSAAALREPGGITLSAGEASRSPDGPAGVGVPVTALIWANIPDHASLTLPAVPLLGPETVTVSVWARSGTDTELNLSVVFLGLDGADLSDAVETHTLRATWRRYSLTTRSPDDAVSARVRFAASGDHVGLAAAQLEAAPEATGWDMGGGAPTVLLDQLERTSPHYPRNDFTVTLLEV